jgi:hypothetical protein
VGAGRRNKSVVRESICQLVDVSVWHINRANAEDGVLCSRVVLMGKGRRNARSREIILKEVIHALGPRTT